MSRARNAAPKDLRARLLAFRWHFATAFKPTQVFFTDAGKKTTAQLIADLDAILKTYTDVEVQRGVLDTLLAARKKAEPLAQEVAARSLAIIHTQYSRNDPVLNNKFFRRKGGAHKQTAGQKVVATAKRLRSRQITGVMGKRQRAAKLRGD